MIYKSIEDLVVAGWGTEIWTTILKQAGVEDPTFIGMSRYPDELAGRIVGAASTVLGIAPDDVMRAFGRHWTTNTAPSCWRGGYARRATKLCRPPAPNPSS